MRPWVHGLRIAILTHTTDPCGAVGHALALGEAFCGLGHEAVVHAPDPTGRGFFRDARCPVVSVAAKPADGDAAAVTRGRIAAYLAHLSMPAACDFDVFHAYCATGGNALATLTRRRLIPGFVRTVHRVDTFADPQLDRFELRGIVDAARLLCVSPGVAATLTATYGAAADIVGCGVDPGVYAPDPGPGDAGLARRLGLGPGPIFLAVGGLTARRNALAVVTAFAEVRRQRPDAQLVVAGGPDGGRSGYAARCCAALEAEGLEVGPGKPVLRTGPVAQADMPGLYRLAQALVLPGTADADGLSVLEAMACGTPVIVSDRPHRTESIVPHAAIRVDPEDRDALARAMCASLEPARRASLRAGGLAVAGARTWAACAARHMPAYAALTRGSTPAPPAATGSGAWNTTRIPGQA